MLKHVCPLFSGARLHLLPSASLCSTTDKLAAGLPVAVSRTWHVMGERPSPACLLSPAGHVGKVSFTSQVPTKHELCFWR